MKLTIEPKALRAGLATVMGVVQSRTTIPILSNVLLKADRQGDLRIAGTDLERRVQVCLDAEVKTGRAITVPGRALIDFVGKLPSSPDIAMEIDGKKDRLIVAAGRSRLVLPTLPAEDYPDFPETGAGAVRLTLDSGDLLALLDRVRLAISTEETRYYLNGVFLEGEPGVLLATATDGHKLAMGRLVCEAAAATLPKVIVPRATVHALGPFLKAANSIVTVWVSPTQVRVETMTASIASKLIDGSYPDYRRVVPPDSGTAATVRLNREAAMAAVDRVMVMAEQDGGRRLSLTASADGIAIATTNVALGGEAADYVDGEIDGKPKGAIGFNGRYLADIFAALGADTVEMALGTPGDPVKIFAGRSGASPDAAVSGPSVTASYVLMPMRL